jgi:hypothetical protein
MKTKKQFYSKITFLLSLLLMITIGCERALSEDVVLATYSPSPDVYIDGFSTGLEYYPYLNSKYEAFSVDTEVKYKGSSSMRFDVPVEGDPAGSYAGAIFRDDNGGRNLTEYDVLTFWAKATQSAKINDIGFGQDFGDNKFQVSKQGLQLTTNWVKYVIPIPDASRLIQEKGMLWYAEGHENGEGYSFWLDEVKFEKLGTISEIQPSILFGEDKVITSFNGVQTTIGGISANFNFTDQINQTILISPAYLEFTSSDTSVATVDEFGVVTTLNSGSTVITATFNEVQVSGSLTLNSLGAFSHAPIPTQDPANVISIFSDSYTNVPVNYYNGYWAPWQTTLSDDFTVEGDNVLQYTIFNFVGMEYSAPTIDATSMTHFHLDAYISGPIAAGREFRVLLVDFGADGSYGGGDDTRHSTTFRAPTLVSQNWISIDLPFSSLTGLGSRSNMAQLILEGGDGSKIFIDNIYFYN